MNLFSNAPMMSRAPKVPASAGLSGPWAGDNPDIPALSALSTEPVSGHAEQIADHCPEMVETFLPSVRLSLGKPTSQPTGKFQGPVLGT